MEDVKERGLSELASILQTEYVCDGDKTVNNHMKFGATGLIYNCVTRGTH